MEALDDHFPAESCPHVSVGATLENVNRRILNLAAKISVLLPIETGNWGETWTFCAHAQAR